MSEQRYCEYCGFLPIGRIRKTAIGNHYCAECECDAIIVPPFLAALQAENAKLKTKLNTSEQLAWDLGGKIEALEAELSTLRESMRWIPVSERLPEDCCDVLVRRENDGAAWTDIASLDNGWFDDIAHWMPLPKPPEDSSEREIAGGENG